MTALFLTPARFAINAASQQATAPASNLDNDTPGRVWRSQDLNGPYVIVATGGIALDSIALLGSNLRAGDQLRIQGASNAAMTSPMFDRTITAWSGTPGKNGTTSVLLLETTCSPAYVRIDITSTGNPAGYVEAQRLVLCSRLACRGVDIGAEKGWQDGSASEDALGSTVFDAQRVRDTWKVSVSNVSAADFWSKWDPFFALVGNRRAFLFIPDQDSPYLQNQQVFGRITSQAKGKALSSDLLSLDINIVQV